MAVCHKMGPDFRRDLAVTRRDSQSDVVELEVALGHLFGRTGLLTAALTHSSVAGSAAAEDSFERLEFLGDRVLGLVVADMLLSRYPDEDEGALSRRLVAAVRREALVEVAGALGLERYMITATSGGTQDQAPERILADGCEALIGAVYLDAGFAAAARVVRGLWGPLLDGTLTPPRDAKTALQEWAQARGCPLPIYTVTGREGPDHRPTFAVEVRVEGCQPALASGSSKRAAEQAAAAALLDRLPE